MNQPSNNTLRRNLYSKFGIARRMMGLATNDVVEKALMRNRQHVTTILRRIGKYENETSEQFKIRKNKK